MGRKKIGWRIRRDERARRAGHWLLDEAGRKKRKVLGSCLEFEKLSGARAFTVSLQLGGYFREWSIDLQGACFNSPAQLGL